MKGVVILHKSCAVVLKYAVVKREKITTLKQEQFTFYGLS